MAVIHRSLVQIRLEGLLLKIVFKLASKDFDSFSLGLGQGFAFSTLKKQEIFHARLMKRYPWWGRLWPHHLTILDSLVVRISACHVEGPGSIPSRGVSFFTVLSRKFFSPNVGLEPTTLRLRVSCSTDWASRADCISMSQKLAINWSYWKLALNQMEVGGWIAKFVLASFPGLGVAGVVVSCKIPILATRVRFPGDAILFFP